MRVYNSNDIVPRTWVSEEFEGLKNLYDSVTLVPDNWKYILDLFVYTLTDQPDSDKYTLPESFLGFTYQLSTEVASWKDHLG